MLNREILKDPYRLLFPLGIISALVGVGIWWFFIYGLIGFYPRQSHANIMFMCFLWSFISGFLMTAVPKMLSAPRPRYLEIYWICSLIILQIVLNISNQSEISVYVFGLQLVTLAVFLLRRILIKRKIPFEGFYFLPFAFLQGGLGIVSFAIWSDYSLFYLFSGQALVLNLVLGLGSRLIPVISRCPNALTPDISGFTRSKTLVASLALVLNVSFWLEGFYHIQAGSFLKLISVLIMSFVLLDIHKKPMTFGFVAYGLKLSVFFLVLNSLVEVFWGLTIAYSHILYIGVFSMVSILVATRVMLAHGQQSLNYELDSKRMLVVIIGFIAATLLRLSAGINIPGVAMKASILVVGVVLVLWLFKFLKLPQ